MSSSVLRNFNYIALNRRKSWSAILFLLINSPGQVKFSICNSNWPQCKKRQRARGRVVRRCLSSISTSYVGERERERERVQSMHFMLITMPFHGEQIGSFACIFQIILQFIWINSLKGSTMQSGLSSKRCGVLASHTELKHYFFNLFISCRSTFLHTAKLSLDSQFWFENRQYPLKTLAQEMFNFNDNRDRMAQRHFDTSEILLNLQKNPNEWHKLN